MSRLLLLRSFSSSESPSVSDPAMRSKSSSTESGDELVAVLLVDLGEISMLNSEILLARGRGRTDHDLISLPIMLGFFAGELSGESGSSMMGSGIQYGVGLGAFVVVLLYSFAHLPGVRRG